MISGSGQFRAGAGVGAKSSRFLDRGLGPEPEWAQPRAGIPPATRACQRGRFGSVGISDGGRRDACPTLRFMERPDRSLCKSQAEPISVSPAPRAPGYLQCRAQLLCSVSGVENFRLLLWAGLSFVRLGPYLVSGRYGAGPFSRRRFHRRGCDQQGPVAATSHPSTVCQLGSARANRTDGQPWVGHQRSRCPRKHGTPPHDG